MTGENGVLTGLWFAGSRDSAKHSAGCADGSFADFAETVRWLDLYFTGHQPDFAPPYRVDHLTPFRREVIDRMLRIPFGATTTYGAIAKDIAHAHGIPKMSAQAVGGAVGWNPICLIIPCHRVVGENGSLTGYGGGLPNKIALLALEGLDVERFSVPGK